MFYVMLLAVSVKSRHVVLFFSLSFFSFIKKAKFLSSPARNSLILKSWGRERSHPSEYRYLLCSSPPACLADGIGSGCPP